MSFSDGMGKGVENLGKRTWIGITDQVRKNVDLTQLGSLLMIVVSSIVLESQIECRPMKTSLGGTIRGESGY
jgi:hypothetical protein